MTEAPLQPSSAVRGPQVHPQHAVEKIRPLPSQGPPQSAETDHIERRESSAESESSAQKKQKKTFGQKFTATVKGAKSQLFKTKVSDAKSKEASLLESISRESIDTVETPPRPHVAIGRIVTKMLLIRYDFDSSTDSPEEVEKAKIIVNAITKGPPPLPISLLYRSYTRVNPDAKSYFRLEKSIPPMYQDLFSIATMARPSLMDINDEHNLCNEVQQQIAAAYEAKRTLPISVAMTLLTMPFIGAILLWSFLMKKEIKRLSDKIITFMADQRDICLFVLLSHARRLAVWSEQGEVKKLCQELEAGKYGDLYRLSFTVEEATTMIYSLGDFSLVILYARVAVDALKKLHWILSNDCWSALCEGECEVISINRFPATKGDGFK